MRRRIMLAALAAAVAVPVSATPASAHGYCGFDYNTTQSSLDGYRYTANLFCDTYHATYDITLCLDWAPVSGDPAGIATPFVLSKCETNRFEGWTTSPHWLISYISDDCRPGFYRTRAEAVMPGGHVANHSHTRLVECAA